MNGDLVVVRICNNERQNSESHHSHKYSKTGRILLKKHNCQKQKQFVVFVYSPLTNNALDIGEKYLSIISSSLQTEPRVSGHR